MLPAYFLRRMASGWLKLLESNGLPMPSLGMMRTARVRLDLCNMMFERHLFVKWAFVRYLIVDASPQLGRNFLCCREDRIKFLRELMHEPELLANFDLNSGFETRVMPLSTLGSGRSSALKKSLNVGTHYLHETGCHDLFDEVRSSVYGGTSDQGAERNIGDETVRIIPGYDDKYAASDPRSFFWPRALWLLGRLHILFNALEGACKHLDIAKDFFESLRVLCSFLSDRQMQRKFQAVCVCQVWRVASRSIASRGPM